MKRYVAHVVIEAQTPLKVGGGKSGLLYDAPVQKDFNSLPMVLGTSLAGILRAALENNSDDKAFVAEIFGTKDESRPENQKGSKLAISNALLVGKDDMVYEKLLEQKDSFLSNFSDLPIREHTAITAMGVAKDASKFDEEIVFKGTRFKFSLELDGSESEFRQVLNLLGLPTLRLGGGGSKGFGKLKIVEIKYAHLGLDEYSSSLNDNAISQKFELSTQTSNEFIKYELRITPENFFMFGSGFGDEDADMTPVFESVIDYDSGDIANKQILIPASSIKGALSHRTAFYYNKAMLDESKEHKNVGEQNTAVREIFGFKKDKNINGKKGRVLISDCFKSYNKQGEKSITKTFDHVAIDRFTGGAIDGALFQEKTIGLREEFCIEIYLNSKDLSDTKSLDAFENALRDVATYRLPLGGATTKGHGFFSGNVYKNGINITEK
ncbi:hypothetical protein CCAL13119_07115 [Campylobacter sp. RM13119]|uniref:RAMP superfamily CRISPR-associated protein n=1 Tax=Campylobacter californiensis TaxID=1032243 RepID=UPI00147582F5|nr:RAMP superfamily CRISPR-associated protein [Campylobacter sp. RM13119]MBE3606712.1 hypothetical protein [Campylobacter sp. RM13119]